DSPSLVDAEIETDAASEKTNNGGETEILQIDQEQEKDVDDQVNLDEKTDDLDQGQAGSDPDPGESRGDLARPDPVPTHDEFMADMYPKFINDKSTEDEPKKPNVEAKVVSMVTVPFYQASSLVPPLFTLIPMIDLSPPKQASSTTQAPVFTATTATTTTPLPPPPQQQSLTKSEMFESGSYKSVPEHIALYEALEASMEWAQRDKFLAEKDKSHKRRRNDQDPPPPPSESDLKTANISDLEDTNIVHLPKTKQRPEWFKPILDNDKPATPELAWAIPTSHIPDAANNWANALASTYQAPIENSLLAKTGGMRTFMHWYCQKMGKTELTQADFEDQAYEVVKSFYPDVVYLQFQMVECHKMLTDQVDWANLEGDQVRINVSKPLPLSGPPGHALSISKMKAAHYLHFGLELLVPEHIWINEVCTYDISASYGISQRWFNRQKFYIDRHIADSSRKIVRTHMRILSVVSIKAFSRYGYDYLKEITLCRADYQEYTIAETDFKRWDAKGFKFKHDYTIIEFPRVVVFPACNNEQKIMRFNEIYKFSDGTLTNILEALDYRVKEYKVNRLNLGADNRPPMLEKDMYDSWKSRMELYMLNRPRGRMILESVEQVPLIWPSVEVEGVTRLKKYSELSAAEAVQADCDFVSSGPSSLTHSISYPVTETSSLVNHNAYMASSSVPQIEYAPMVQQSSKYSPPEAGLVVLVFQNGDDPIDVINHMMSFLTSVVASRYPATNNQLRTSLNPRQQATINNGRVTI
nr:hypothetical protein [Tanacetum cinerariifolium]